MGRASGSGVRWFSCGGVIFDEDFCRCAGGEGDGVGCLGLHGEDFGGEVAIEDGDGAAGQELMSIQELEEWGRLVFDAGDGSGLAGLAFDEVGLMGTMDGGAVGGGDRVAVRVGVGLTEKIVDALEDFF